MIFSSNQLSVTGYCRNGVPPFVPAPANKIAYNSNIYHDTLVFITGERTIKVSISIEYADWADSYSKDQIVLSDFYDKNKEDMYAFLFVRYSTNDQPFIFTYKLIIVSKLEFYKNTPYPLYRGANLTDNIYLSALDISDPNKIKYLDFFVMYHPLSKDYFGGENTSNYYYLYKNNNSDDIHEHWRESDFYFPPYSDDRNYFKRYLLVIRQNQLSSECHYIQEGNVSGFFSGSTHIPYIDLHTAIGGSTFVDVFYSFYSRIAYQVSAGVRLQLCSPSTLDLFANYKNLAIIELVNKDDTYYLYVYPLRIAKIDMDTTNKTALATPSNANDTFYYIDYNNTTSTTIDKYITVYVPQYIVHSSNAFNTTCRQIGNQYYTSTNRAFAIITNGLPEGVYELSNQTIGTEFLAGKTFTILFNNRGYDGQIVNPNGFQLDYSKHYTQFTIPDQNQYYNDYNYTEFYTVTQYP